MCPINCSFFINIFGVACYYRFLTDAPSMPPVSEKSPSNKFGKWFVEFVFAMFSIPMDIKLYLPFTMMSREVDVIFAPA